VDDGIAALQRASSSIAGHRVPRHPDAGIERLSMVARQLARRCHIAFVTAFDGYAVQAFEQGAIDYVMKPLTSGRLVTTVARTEGAARRAAAARPHGCDRAPRRPRGDGSELPALDHRLARRRGAPHHGRERSSTFKATTSTPSFVTRDGRVGDPQDHQGARRGAGSAMFWQIHRSALVNVNAIDSVCATSAARASCGSSSAPRRSR
jgi:hypothetical protein